MYTLPVEDRRDQFHILVCETCAAAALARLRVMVRTCDGTEVMGIPHAPPVAENAVDPPPDDTELIIDGRRVTMDEVAEITIHQPDGVQVTSSAGAAAAR